MKLNSTISELISRQHGIITRAQLVDNSLPDWHIASLVRAGVLLREKKSLYRMSGTRDTWYQRAAISVFSCGKHARLSHLSVLVLFGILSELETSKSRSGQANRFSQPIHVTSNCSLRYRSDISVHRTKYLDAMPARYLGLPHTSIERAILESARYLSENEIYFVIEQALGRRLISLKRIANELDTLPSAPGREKEKIQVILYTFVDKELPSHLSNLFEKKVESAVKKVCAFPIVPQYELHVNGHLYRLDIAIPDLKIAIEADGFAYHHTRNKFNDDRARQNELVENGWVVIRVTTKFSEARIQATLRRIIEMRVGFSTLGALPRK